MLEETNNLENTEPVVDTGNPVDDTSASNDVTNTNDSNEGKNNETFTQEKVNQIVVERLERQHKSFLSKYGVESDSEFENLIGVSQAYNVLKERNESNENKIRELETELTLRKNNVNPERYDDVKAYFKGKELEFNNDALLTELATHPEWLINQQVEKPTTIQTLGTEQGNHNLPESEEEKMKRMFGL